MLCQLDNRVLFILLYFNHNLSLSSKPLNICLLSYRSSPHSGGQGVYLYQLSRALTALGHRVDVLSGEPYPELHESVRLVPLPGLNLYEKGLTSLRLHHLRSYANIVEWLSKLTGGFAEPYAFGRRALKYLKQHRHDYDLVHDNQSLCYSLLKIPHYGLKVVATIHHPITRDLKIALENTNSISRRILLRRWYRFLSMQKYVAKRLRSVIVISKSSKTDTQTDFGVKPEVMSLIYNGIDSSQFRPLENIACDPYLLITTASADQPIKGLAYLLRAVAMLKENYPELRLLIIGPINKGGATDNLINELGIKERIVNRTNISADEFVQNYARSSIAVSPSLYEGFGLPAAEAMACEVPIVASQGGALPEVVGDAGVLVKSHDSEALAKAIADLLDNPEKRSALATKGRERVLELFNWHNTALETVAVYRKLLDHAHH